ncbi:hypothetical protein CRV15_35390 (plasmid) [Streptomyces clavuligerus]|uniref:Uncharacterized protein n=1 Tax=Streptomyces clavuligerus TaxID=1901 RepID=B5GLX2_STRCL|nr:hypothetical protein SSCG_00346 [Streptomyces clavuligerus]EFG04978.1 Hypothetical protein SCLAV_p1496 [Streptomyces clavuligerus]QCS10798.1 hypothetical protein CRV15_35390 [Streptomyces clavuligerus]QPJ97167.1 hypothetical protein GE265_29095 [Streptomyces clavuligerus]
MSHLNAPATASGEARAAAGPPEYIGGVLYEHRRYGGRSAILSMGSKCRSGGSAHGADLPGPRTGSA